MKKIKIKGNDYVMVHERTKEFHNLYPNGSIKTEIIEMTERFITVTTVIPDVANPGRLFTGIACEIAKDEFSISVAETSSVGRALGFLSIGIDTSIASYEEVANAIGKQEKSKPKPVSKPDQEVVNMMHNVVNPVTVQDVKDKFGEDNVAEVKYLVTFGKHNGKEWKDVPDNYVDWVVNNSKVDWQRVEAKKELDRRNPVEDIPTKKSGGMSEQALEEQESDGPEDIVEPEPIPF